MKRFLLVIALLQFCADCYSNSLERDFISKNSCNDNFFIISGEHVIKLPLKFGGSHKNLWIEKTAKITFVEKGKFILRNPWTIVDTKSHSVFASYLGNTKKDLNKILIDRESNKINPRNSVEIFQEDRRCIKIPNRVTIRINASDIVRNMLIVWIENGGKATFEGDINFFKLKKFIFVNENTHVALTSFQEILLTDLCKIFDT